jgi:hypothetical protein
MTGMILTSGLTTWNVTTKNSVSALVYLTIVLDGLETIPAVIKNLEKQEDDSIGRKQRC